MAISSVSFGQNLNWAQTISRPQAYVKNEIPVAATKIEEEKPKKSGAGKVVLGTIVVAGAAATGLALGAKFGKFVPKEGASDLKIKVLGYADKAGNFILEKTSSLVQKAKDLVSKAGADKADDVAAATEQVTTTAEQVAEQVTETVAETVVETVAETAGKVAETVVETVENVVS